MEENSDSVGEPVEYPDIESTNEEISGSSESCTEPDADARLDSDPKEPPSGKVTDEALVKVEDRRTGADSIDGHESLEGPEEDKASEVEVGVTRFEKCEMASRVVEAPLDSKVTNLEDVIDDFWSEKEASDPRDDKELAQKGPVAEVCTEAKLEPISVPDSVRLVKPVVGSVVEKTEDCISDEASAIDDDNTVSLDTTSESLLVGISVIEGN